MLSPVDCGTGVEVRFDLASEAGMRNAWEQNQAALRAFACRRLGDRDLAQDMVQETFLRAWSHASSFDRARGDVRGWLYAIMRNLLTDVARSHARRPKVSELVDEWPARDDIDALLGSLTAAAALDRLSPDHREVMVHGYVSQLPTAEIAQLLDVPAGTVRSRLFYARAAFVQALSAIGVASSSGAPRRAGRSRAQQIPTTSTSQGREP